MDNLETRILKLIDTLQKSNNEDLADLVAQFVRVEPINQLEIEDDNTATGALTGDRVYKLLDLQRERADRGAISMKAKNPRKYGAKVMLDAWNHYVKNIIKRESTKDLVDEEQNDFAGYIYASLTDVNESK